MAIQVQARIPKNKLRLISQEEDVFKGKLIVPETPYLYSFGFKMI